MHGYRHLPLVPFCDFNHRRRRRCRRRYRLAPPPLPCGRYEAGVGERAAAAGAAHRAAKGVVLEGGTWHYFEGNASATAVAHLCFLSRIVCAPWARISHLTTSRALLSPRLPPRPSVSYRSPY